MADLQENSKIDLQSNYSVGTNNDPKNMQELTQYVQSLLQQMQDRFQTMSDQVINRIHPYSRLAQCFFGVSHRCNIVTGDRTCLCFAKIGAHASSLRRNSSVLDEMGNRIDDLEKNIADLMTQAGVEGPEK